MFGWLLGLGSFDSEKRPLAHKQPSFLIAFGGIDLILTTTIAPTTYLRNWAFVLPIITFKFIVSQCPFLFEALTQADNNTFPFQQHLKVVCDFLLPPIHACFLPFEQPIRQQMVQLQDSISKHLHHHTLSRMLFNKIYKTHHAQILSCSDLETSTWLTYRPTCLTFWLSSPSFYTTFQTWLGLSHLLIVSIPWCVYTHPIDATSVQLLYHTYNNEHTCTHDVVHDSFVAIAWDDGFHVGCEQLYALPLTTFHSSCWWVDIVFTKNGIYTLADVVITNPTRTNLFHQSLCNSRICYLQSCSSQRKELLWPTPH